MKILGYILISFFSLLLFILLTRIRIFLIFDGNLNVVIKVHFIKLKFYVPLLYRQKKSEEENEEYLYAQKEDKQTKKDEKKPKKAKEKLPFPGIKNTLLFFKEAVVDILGTIIHSFRLEKLHFRAVAASDDAAKTAELYGIICTVSTALHQFATNAKRIKKDAVFIETKPDFFAEKADFYADIRISIRIFRLLIIAKKALSAYMGYKKLAKKVLEEKNAENSSEKTDNASSAKNSCESSKDTNNHKLNKNV